MANIETFEKINELGRDFFRNIWLVRRFVNSTKKCNEMFNSSEVGSITDMNVSVRTATISETINGVTSDRDVVVLNANDACDKEIDVLLSKQDCIELMAYLSAATFALRD